MIGCVASGKSTGQTHQSSEIKPLKWAVKRMLRENCRKSRQSEWVTNTKETHRRGHCTRSQRFHFPNCVSSLPSVSPGPVKRVKDEVLGGCWFSQLHLGDKNHEGGSSGALIHALLDSKNSWAVWYSQVTGGSETDFLFTCPPKIMLPESLDRR